MVVREWRASINLVGGFSWVSKHYTKFIHKMWIKFRSFCSPHSTLLYLWLSHVVLLNFTFGESQRIYFHGRKKEILVSCWLSFALFNTQTIFVFIHQINSLNFSLACLLLTISSTHTLLLCNAHSMTVCCTTNELNFHGSLKRTASEQQKALEQMQVASSGAESHSSDGSRSMVQTKTETTKKRKSLQNKKKRKKKKKRKQQQQSEQQKNNKLVHGVKNENFELRNVGRRVEKIGRTMVEGSNYVITTSTEASHAIDSGSSSSIVSESKSCVRPSFLLTNYFFSAFRT